MADVLNRHAIDAPCIEPPVLTVEISCTGSRCVLTMAGELNGTSIAALEMQIDQIGCSECEDVVLDVTRLTSLDLIGTRVVMGLDTYVRALGARLTVVGASGQVARTLRPTRLLGGDAEGAVGSRWTVGYPHRVSRRGEPPSGPPDFVS